MRDEQFLKLRWVEPATAWLEEKAKSRHSPNLPFSKGPTYKMPPILGDCPLIGVFGGKTPPNAP